MTLITLVLLTLFVGLGRWQWQRGEAKQAVWNAFERNDATPVLNARVDLDASIDSGASRLSGRFEPRGSSCWTTVRTPASLDMKC